MGTQPQGQKHNTTNPISQHLKPPTNKDIITRTTTTTTAATYIIILMAKHHPLTLNLSPPPTDPAQIPKSNAHIAPRAYQPSPINARRNRPDPIRMADDSLDAVTRVHVPQLQRAVLAGADQHVGPPGDESDRTDNVLVALKRPYVLVPVQRVPELYAHVRAAARKQLQAVIDVQHGFRVALQRPLQLAQLPVPDLHGRVF